MNNKTSNLIKELNRLDLETIDYNNLLEKIKPIVTNIQMHIQMSKSTELFFRSRVCNNKEIDNLDELLAPPNHLVKGFQRCNSPGNSMFYSSSKRITTLLECNVMVGDTVYLTQWVNKKSIPLNMLFSNIIENNSTKKLTLDEEIIISYLDTIFTRQIHKSFSNAYKLTAAITELITNNFKPNPIHDIRSDGNAALVYPSVFDISNSYNTALLPDFAKERLQFLHVMKIKITERNDRSIKIKIINNAREVIDGKIYWLNDETKIPLLIEDKSKGLLFQYTGKVWSIPLGDSKITESTIEDLLNE
jgi:hypothetical protein